MGKDSCTVSKMNTQKRINIVIWAPILDSKIFPSIVVRRTSKGCILASHVRADHDAAYELVKFFLLYRVT